MKNCEFLFMIIDDLFITTKVKYGFFLISFLIKHYDLQKCNMPISSAIITNSIRQPTIAYNLNFYILPRYYLKTR